jgi:lysozyme
MIDFDLLAQELTSDEKTVLVVYDDKTGLPIKPGTLVIGHPTIGTGRCLDTNGISAEEDRMLLKNDMWSRADELYRKLPWLEALDDVRQRVLVNMSFQMGVDGLLGFHDTLAAVQSGAYAKAAQHMLASQWANQTPARAKRLAERIRTGVVEYVA